MPRISELSSLTVPADDDLLAIVDTSGAITARITRGDFLTGSDLPDDTVTTDAIQDSAVTADKMNLPYSTTEHLTGRTWINGKPIYEKTVSFGALPNTTTKDVAHGITGIQTIVRFDTTIITPSSGVYMYGGAWPDAMANNIYSFVNLTNCSIRTGNNRTDHTAIFTIQYTKT